MEADRDVTVTGVADRALALGLMAEAGCLYVTDADRPIVNSKVMRRVLSYAKAFGVLVAHRPADPWLTAGAAASEGEFAARMGLPAVSYYGGRTVPFLKERPKAPLLMHFGENDPLIPPDDVAAHREALPDAEIHVWPGAGHGFDCDQRADYNAEASQQALQRTLMFLQKNLR